MYTSLTVTDDRWETEMTNEAAVSLAYDLHKGRSVHALARYISRFTSYGFCSTSEALRIASRCKTAAEFFHVHETMECWHDCHNDCEVA
jgi:hypothetical protein